MSPFITVMLISSWRISILEICQPRSCVALLWWFNGRGFFFSFQSMNIRMVLSYSSLEICSNGFFMEFRPGEHVNYSKIYTFQVTGHVIRPLAYCYRTNLIETPCTWYTGEKKGGLIYFYAKHQIVRDFFFDIYCFWFLDSSLIVSRPLR